MSLMNRVLNKKTEKQYRILFVDDSPTSLEDGKAILQDLYHVDTASSTDEMFHILEEKSLTPDLILLNADMRTEAELTEFNALDRLKTQPETQGIPVVLLFEKPNEAQRRQVFTLGAEGYITKPFFGPILLKRVEAHLLVSRQQQELLNLNTSLHNMVRGWTTLLEDEVQRIKELQSAIVAVMAEMVDCRDDVTGGHIERTKQGVGRLLSNLIKHCIYENQIDGWDVEMIMRASQLHDVGKIYISDVILQKPGKLTSDEFNIMKKHTDYGNTIIDRIESITRPNDLTRHAKIFAGFHHEKWDGSGYPLGLVGQDIPLQGRLMAVADVYDALVSDRPYKKGMLHEEALEIIKQGSGFHFDPILVELFLEDEDNIKALYQNSKSDETLMRLVAQE